jgi:hypothetical protein
MKDAIALIFGAGRMEAQREPLDSDSDRASS